MKTRSSTSGVVHVKGHIRSKPASMDKPLSKVRDEKRSFKKFKSSKKNLKNMIK